MLDEWSKAIIGEHRVDIGDTPSHELLHKLEFHATFQEEDVADIEARHATVRRLLVSRSVQTHVIKFEDANAEWILHRARLSGRKSKRQRTLASSRRKRHAKTQDTQAIINSEMEI